MTITVHQLCQEIPRLNEFGKFDVGTLRRGETVANVAEGLTPRRAPVKVERGEARLHLFEPEELLALIIPTVSVNGTVRGYQRPFQREHARKMAVAMRDGAEFPVGEVGCDGNGKLFAVDMQHRAVAGVIARRPVLAVVRRMSQADQRQVFGDQRKAKPVDRNVLILAGTSDFEMRPVGRLADHALTLGSASQPQIPERITNWSEDWNRRRRELLYDATAPERFAGGDRGRA